VSRGKVLAVSAAVAVAAAVVAILIAGGGTATADEVRFQNVSERGPDPFTASADVPKPSSGSSSTDGGSSSSSSESSPSTGSPESSPSETGDGSSGDSGSSGDTSPTGGSGGEGTDGTEPGTFGGTGKNTVCDREKLIEALSGDPDKLAAWAETAGVEPTEEAVGAYIRKLRPATLTEDTQVTNHSYSGGQANPYQAILQKGTAVLVDDEGKPVTRCRCGNPLAEPVQLAQEVRCIDCPPNYQPPPPCEGRCYRPEHEAPPVHAPGENGEAKHRLESAKEAFERCRREKGDAKECRSEYEKAKELCAKESLKDTLECKDLAETVEPTMEQEEEGGDTGQEPDTGQGEGETPGSGGTDGGTTGGETPSPDGGTTGETPPAGGGTATP